MGRYLLLLCLGLSACGGTPHPRPILGEVPEIVAVRFTGAERFSKATLLGHLYMGETSWVPLSPDYHLSEAMLPVDAARIEALYAAHGYHAAKVLAVRVVPTKDKDEVEIEVEIDEGPPTLVERVTFDWAPNAGLDPVARAAIEAESPVKVGAPFEVPALNETVGLTRLRLLNWGYPHAKVVSDTTVSPDARSARVVLHVNPGPYAIVGTVKIDGLQQVPEDLVANEVAFADGLGFSPGLLQAIGHTAKGMDLFQWVTVVPDPEVKDGVVDVHLRVSEADPQTLRLGGRVVFEAARWEQQLVASYTHTNLFGRLVRLDLDILAGWAELPDPFVDDANAPILTVEPTFTKKGWIEDYLLWTFRPRFDLDVQPGYRLWSPSGAFGVGRWLGHHLRLDLSYNIAYSDFFEVTPALDASTTDLGLDFRDPYLLSWMAFTVDVPWVDDLRSPTNGSVLTLEYNLAGGGLQGDFDFHKFTGGWRGYWKPWTWLQFALRTEGGLILGYSDNPSAPIDRRFYLGGTNTVRAWGSRQLAPRLATDESVPVGGSTSVLGSFESRIPIGKWSLVGFYDVGDVQQDEVKFVPDEWNHTAGPGLRFDSPVGLVRLDAGFRLNDPGVYTDVPKWGVHFGFGEAF